MGATPNIDVKVTPVFYWNYGCRARYVINQGGSRSSKTFSILQVLCFRAMEVPGTVITVTAETLPTLRKGSIRDFEEIIKHQPFASWVVGVNRSTNTYRFENGSILEFAAFPDSKAATHGSRDYVFFNEANHIGFDTAKQLMMRTRKQVYIDFNPTSDFWAHEKYLADKTAQWFFSTYRNNPFAPPEMVAEIERYKTESPEHYKVFGLGKRGALTGQVFGNVNWVPSLPQYLQDVRYGMDFGFANSFTTICKIGLSDGKVWGQELMYKHGLIEPQIVQYMDGLGIDKTVPILADSANPMLISYLCQMHMIEGKYMGGYNVQPCVKKDVKSEIFAMKRYTWNITDDSTNWKKEAKNYIYRRDKDGSLDNTPVKAYDHLWDGARYAFLSMVGDEGLQWL